MIIKNRAELSTSKLRKQASDIIEAGINSVLPTAIMKSAIKYDRHHGILTVQGTMYDLSKGRVFVIGCGKASGMMAEALEDIISPENITDGVVICKSCEYKTRKTRILGAGHPVPDMRGITGAKEVLALKERYSIGRNDVVLCLISGGGSALMSLPVDQVSLEDKRRITQLLLSGGAMIHEINTVRKHLSRVKGGRLGQHFAPATVISLIISDVVGDDLAVIASGPTSPDPTSFRDASEILRKYDLASSAPENIINFLWSGCRNEVMETPKVLSNCHNHLICNNKVALTAMARKAQKMGFVPCVITAEQTGNTSTVAQSRAGEILKGKYSGYDMLLIGGETTLTLPDSPGKGGRNQHYAAVSMLSLADYSGEWLVASVATDGSDYLPGVAGAIVDGSSLRSAHEKGLNVNAYIERFDSNSLLAEIGGSLIKMDNSGTNVADVILYIMR